MQPKTLSKRRLLIIISSGFVLVALLLIGAFLFNSIPKNSTQDGSTLVIENVATHSNQEQTNIELPARLKIPVIEVDAAVVPVGLTPDGEMDVPKDPSEVAWFNLGPHDGKTGSNVIAGHYDWKNNVPAVFDNLDKLSKGDNIFIEDEKGVTTDFIVREIRTYEKDEEASDVFGSDDDKAHLNLVTCTGAWNKAENSYSERLVVFTDKE